MVLRPTELPETMTTERLVLRKPRAKDARGIYMGYACDPEVSRYMAWVPHETIDHTKHFVRETMACWKGLDRRPWIITRRGSTDEPLGMIEVRLHGFRAEVGYVLRRSEWGQGLMTEALREVVERTLTLAGIYRIGAVCDVDNLASARVMVKAGLEREGRLRRWVLHPNLGPEPRDVFSHARVR